VKVLVTRTDRLGDLVLSVPVFEYLKSAQPDLEIHALVAPAAVPLVENNPYLTGIWTWNENESADSFKTLTDGLRGENFDAAIMLQYRKELAQLLLRAKIGLRYGPWSRFSSWFLLNRGSRQARSHSKLHEMDQNLRLAGKFLGDSSPKVDFPQPTLYLTPGQRDLGQEFRAEYQVQEDKIVFLHPGSGGSALDWNPNRFAGVANSLAGMEGFRVFITGTSVDEAMVEKVSLSLDQQVTVLLNRYNLRDFLGILSAGDYFIGPSTGPLHLAAALGLGTVGLYPPVPTMSPGRWGPRGPWTKTVMPRVDCPASRLCSGERCPHFNCMNEVFERDVLGAVMEIHRQKSEEES